MNVWLALASTVNYRHPITDAANAIARRDSEFSSWILLQSYFPDGGLANDHNRYRR